jgi:uncharacterized membrane protein HdeD (DUF308 family)
MTPNSTTEYQPKLNPTKNMGLGVSIVAIVLGIAAILLPSFTTLVVESWLAFVLISVGTSNTFYAIQRRPEGFGWQIFLGILYIGTGILLFINPLGSALTLTLLLGSFFLTEGVVESVMAFKVRPQKNWGWVLANGVLTFGLGLLVWLGWPRDAFWTIGTLVGISVLSTGISRLMLALHASTTPMPPSLPDASI